MFYKPSSGGCKQTWVNYCITGMIIPMNTPTPDPNDPEYPLVNKHSYGKWPIVDFPIEQGDLNHSYVSHYQRVNDVSTSPLGQNRFSDADLMALPLGARSSLWPLFGGIGKHGLDIFHR